MRKVYNFSAGPGMIPEEVMRTAQEEFLDWHGTGMSIMEIGHRTEAFQHVAKKAEADLREIMGVPENYHVLFLTGGATAQFAMVPLNLMSSRKKADYINTGIWSKKAIDEAKRYGDINIAATSFAQDDLMSIPDQSGWNLQADADYVHYTPNETINGLEFNWVPDTKEIPLVADMSSMILSRPVDVRKYGIIYAGAQKNMGQSGVTLAIVRDDLIREPNFLVPSLYSYQLQAKNQSFYNTPPTYSWYVAGLVYDWVKRQGGVEAMHAINQRKAKKLYALLDEDNDFYFSTVHKNDRSLMNVVFSLKNDTLNQAFLDEATAAGLTNLQGHRVVGGMRASIYNAMPEEGVDALIAFMREFSARNSS